MAIFELKKELEGMGVIPRSMERIRRDLLRILNDEIENKPARGEFSKRSRALIFEIGCRALFKKHSYYEALCEMKDIESCAKSAQAGELPALRAQWRKNFLFLKNVRDSSADVKVWVDFENEVLKFLEERAEFENAL